MLSDDVHDMTNEELGGHMRGISKEIARLGRLKRMTPEEKELRIRHLFDQLEPAQQEVRRRIQAEDWQRDAQGLRPAQGYGRPGYKPGRRDGRQRLLRARQAAGLSQQEAATVLGLPVPALQSLESIDEGDETKAIQTSQIWDYGDLLWPPPTGNLLA